MQTKDSARSALRSATAPHHDRVDHVFSVADLTDRAAYGRFLMAQAGAHIPVEEALTQAGAESIFPDWTGRQRADLLRTDLAALGLEPPAATDRPAFDTPAAVIGGAYVLEGSRLGGQLLRRSVPAAFPCSFLGAGDSAAWRRLLSILDEQLIGDIERGVAIEAAIGVFEQFERSGRRHLRTE